MSTSTLQATFTLPSGHVLRRAPSALLGLGVVGLAVLGAGALLDREQFFRSYLVAFMFWGGIAFGSFGLVALNHIAGGRWGIVIRRICEAAIRTLPLVLVLFLPIVLGMHDLYEWADPNVVAHDKILQFKAAWYLNPTFFVVRAALYFAIWILFGRLMLRVSLEQDATGSEQTVRSLQLLGRGAIVLYALTMTFASVDWMMSIEPHWYSTIYGLMVIIGPGAVRLRVRHRHPHAARRIPDGGGGRQLRALPRPRQDVAGVRDDLCLLRLLAVPHHLVGEHSGGDAVVPEADHRRLAGAGDRAAAVPLLPAVLRPALAQAEAESRAD